MVFITEYGVIDVPFTPAIQELYEVLASEDRVWSQEELFTRLWGFVPQNGTTAIQMRVSLARRILAEYGIHDKIKTRVGSGYILG